MASSSSPAHSSSVASSSSSSAGYIEHPVSKLDTLAGIAIKYGVEITDIKRLNGLVTDREIFAHKSLRIPLPGRHPPSPILSNGSPDTAKKTNLRTAPGYPSWDFLKDFQSIKLKSPQQNVSPAMSSLQGYYGLVSSSGNDSVCGEGTEMAVYKTNRIKPTVDEPSSPPRGNGDSNSSFGYHQKSRSIENGFHLENGELLSDVLVLGAGDSNGETLNDKSVRRRQKVDDDPASPTPDLILKEDASGSAGFLARSGKGLALRPKSASRTNLADCITDSNGTGPVSSTESLMSNGSAGVRRSSSTSNLQESFDNAASSWSASKWMLKPDLQALSAVAITRPIFDGLPKPITGKRSKAALD